jgi:Co/Zn/Cd efflux system component
MVDPRIEGGARMQATLTAIKAEYFSAVLIVLAALAILREAYFGYLNPRPLVAPAIGLTVNAFASGLNGAWYWFLIRHGRRWRSPALIADGKHLLTDVVTSGGVLVARSRLPSHSARRSQRAAASSPRQRAWPFAR